MISDFVENAREMKKMNEGKQIVNTKTGEWFSKDGYFVYVAYPKAKIRNKGG
jgi:hypothetical protein